MYHASSASCGTAVILGTTRRDKVTNTTVLQQAGCLRIHPLLNQHRLRWLGHVRRMEDGRILKDIRYGELTTGHRLTGQPALRTCASATRGS